MHEGLPIQKTSECVGNSAVRKYRVIEIAATISITEPAAYNNTVKKSSNLKINQSSVDYYAAPRKINLSSA